MNSLNSKQVVIGQQNKHIPGTHEYNQYVAAQNKKGQYGPSQIYGGIEAAQKLVDEFIGKGIPRISNGK